MRLSELLTEPNSKIFNLRLKLRSDIHIGAGSGGIGWVDRAIIRDSQGLPYIPGSHLKGIVRDNAERIRDLTTPSDCRAPRPDGMCPREASPQDCIVCSIFGNPRSPSTVIFSDMHISEALLSHSLDPNLLVTVRNQVSIDRYRRTAKDARLFSSETVGSGAEFFGTIKILRKLNNDEELLLKRALALTDKVGAGKSVGLGNIEIAYEEAK